MTRDGRVLVTGEVAGHGGGGHAQDVRGQKLHVDACPGHVLYLQNVRAQHRRDGQQEGKLFLILPIKDLVEGLYSNTFFVGGALLVTGLLTGGRSWRWAEIPPPPG